MDTGHEGCHGSHTVSTLSYTVCLNSPAAYLASVRANELSRIFFPMPSLVSTIFFRICLNLSQAATMSTSECHA